MREWVWAPLLIVAGILLPGLTAPTADAGPNEDRAFIATLDEFGVPYTIEPHDADTLALRIGTQPMWTAAATRFGDGWRVVLFSDGVDGATVETREQAEAWLHRLGRLHVKPIWSLDDTLETLETAAEFESEREVQV